MKNEWKNNEYLQIKDNYKYYHPFRLTLTGGRRGEHSRYEKLSFLRGRG